MAAGIIWILVIFGGLAVLFFKPNILNINSKFGPAKSKITVHKAKAKFGWAEGGILFNKDGIDLAKSIDFNALIQPPVYNVEIEPKSSRNPLILAPDKEIRAKFYIGRRSDDSLTPDIEPAELIEILAEGKPLDLTVTLFSDLSDAGTYQQRKIRYDPLQKRSNSAEFRLMPKSAAVRGSDGHRSHF